MNAGQGLLNLTQTFAFLIFHFITAFGSGFLFGIWLVNLFKGWGKPNQMKIHEKNIKKALQHNAQWHPTHQRWQKRT